MSFGGNRDGGGRGGDREGGRGGDREGGRGGREDGARRPFFRRKKTCPFSGDNAPKIDYKDVKLLQRFISERGKIVPSPHHRGSATRSSASWPTPSSAPASWRCCPMS